MIALGFLDIGADGDERRRERAMEDVERQKEIGTW